MKVFKYIFPLFSIIFSINSGYAIQLTASCELGVSICIQNGRIGESFIDNEYHDIWMSSDTYNSNWLNVDFDPNSDPNWNQAFSFENITDGLTEAITPSDENHISGTNSAFMWHDESSQPINGVTGPTEAFFLYRVNIEVGFAQFIDEAEAKIQVDDDYKFYINGEEVCGNYANSNVSVCGNHDGGYADIVDNINFKDVLIDNLIDGYNIFAIHAVDGAWLDGNGDPTPYLRSYHDVLIDASITYKVAVPEPPVISLFVLALGITSFSNGRIRKKLLLETKNKY